MERLRKVFACDSGLVCHVSHQSSRVESRHSVFISTNNILNTYSVGLSIQALGRPFAKIPRICWTVIGWIIYTVAGAVGREHFAEILSNFLAILGYWSSFFIVGVLEEHYIFRRRTGALGGYNLDDWDTPGRSVKYYLCLETSPQLP